MGIIRREIKKAKKYFKLVGFKSATLTRKTRGTRTPGSESAGTNPTSTEYTCTAMVEKRKAFADGTLVAEGNALITIIGGTLPDGFMPKAGDTILLAAVTYTVVKAATDSDEAVFECEVMT